MLYFAYGSNMSSARLKARTRSATSIVVASLAGHDLRFHKKSKDGSGKCDAFHTGDEAHELMGVLYELSRSEIDVLDEIEGVGVGYEKKEVTVLSVECGGERKAFTYYATHIDAALKPFCWYKTHVVMGAKEHGLPLDYMDRIGRVDFIVDKNEYRRESEMRIYASI